MLFEATRPGFSGPFFCLIASGNLRVALDYVDMEKIKGILRAIVRNAALNLLRVRWHVRPDSTAALRAGGCLVICNHCSFLDGVLLALISPAPLTFTSEREQSIDNMFTSSGMKFLAWLGFGSILPLDSGAPMAIRVALRCLEQRQNVMIFPDGKITGAHEITSPQPGVEWLARRTNCTVISAKIYGAEDHWLFGKNGHKFFPLIRVEI